MAFSFLSSVSYTSVEAYNGFLSGYDDYLDLNFDGTANSINIMGKIYLSGKINNEIYTLKEMLKQKDRKEFEKAMRAEVEAMFENDIWTKVSRKSMNDYYTSLRRNGQDLKRKHIMMI